jgi:hypothetical protein
MGIMDKAKGMLGMDEATDDTKDAKDKAAGASKSKSDQVSGKANDMMGGMKDKAKGATDSAKESGKKVTPDSTDKHVDKGANRAHDGIDKIGS